MAIPDYFERDYKPLLRSIVKTLAGVLITVASIAIWVGIGAVTVVADLPESVSIIANIGGSVGGIIGIALVGNGITSAIKQSLTLSSSKSDSGTTASH